MLSDCKEMVGGETALRTGSGEVLKVRGPSQGCAVVLQGRYLSKYRLSFCRGNEPELHKALLKGVLDLGRYIEHQALRAFGQAERISMVTSFRPRNCSLPDDTVLTTVRPISDLSELYLQYGEYRMEILEERIRDQLRALRETRRSGKKLNVKGFKGFLRKQEEFLAHMSKEMIDDALVKKGEIDDSHLLKNQDAKTGPANRKRSKI